MMKQIIRQITSGNPPISELTLSLPLKLEQLLTEMNNDTTINFEFRSDIESALNSVTNLAIQLSNPSFSFDAVMEHYCTIQQTLSRLLTHATRSRPRINGYGLASPNHTLLPFFTLGLDEAERMRTGMGGDIPINVVSVEVIHRSSFRPLPNPPPAENTQEPTPQ